MPNLTAIEGIGNLNTSEVTTMEDMFNGCSKLAALDVSGFNTDKVTNMCNMFRGCSLLTALDVSQFNTSNVTSMQNMFGKCSNLQSVDVSEFNTDNVTDMMYMFNECPSLTSLDLSSFNVSSVTKMNKMFNGDSSQNAIYVNEDFSVADNCKGADMFSGCTGLNVGTTVDQTMANYKTGYLTLRRHFMVGAEKYGVDGYEDAKCYADVKFADGEEFSSTFDFNFASGKEASYERSVTSNWATLCLPFSFSTDDNDNCKFYEIANIGDGSISVKKITGNVVAGTPVLVYTNAGSFSVSNDAGASVVTKPADSDNLAGTFDDMEVENVEGNYIISRNVFWSVPTLLNKSQATSVKIAPYRAYIKNVTGSAKPASFDIVAGETDGISNVDDTQNFLDGAEYYDLQGRRLESPVKGMMIVKNGAVSKKMLFQ